MNKMIEYHSNSIIPYISYPKEINILMQYFYMLNISLVIQLINVYLWTNYFTEYFAILLTFPALASLIIQNKYVVKQYNKLTKKIKVLLCELISEKITNILNIVAKDILDCKCEIYSNQIYEYLKKIDYYKIIAIIKDIIYCYTMIYLSSFTFLAIFKNSTDRKKKIIENIILEKDIESLFKANTIYSIYDLYQSSKNTRLKEISQSNIKNINNGITIFGSIWSISIFLKRLNINDRVFVWVSSIFFKQQLMIMNLETFIPWFYIDSSPIIILLTWFFSISLLKIKINKYLFYTILNISIHYLLSSLGSDTLLTVLLILMFYKYKYSEIYFAVNYILLFSNFNPAHAFLNNFIAYYIILICEYNKKIDMNVVENYFERGVLQSVIINKKKEKINLLENHFKDD
jgi:hypothetical protein